MEVDMTVVEQQESCLRFLQQNGIRNVTVNVCTKFGALEPYQLHFAKGRSKTNEPFHVCFHQLNQLIDGDGEIYGRTPWGPWCKLTVFCYLIMRSKPMPELDREKFAEVIYGESSKEAFSLTRF